MDLMKSNMVHRGLVYYKGGILFLLVRIMGRGKGYMSRGGGGGGSVTTMESEYYIKQKLVARVPRSQPVK